MKTPLAILVLAGLLAAGGAGRADAGPVARDHFNAGTKFLTATNFAEAERSLLAALAAQEESVQAPALFNLGHARFADGEAILQRGPEAGQVSAQSRAALAAGERALQSGSAALVDNRLENLLAAYLAGRGARQNLKAAEKAVKTALQTHGKTLARWQSAANDFKSAAELDPAGTNATHNLKAVQQRIAALVDQMQQWQQMLGQMAGQKGQLGKMLSQLKGQIPAPNAPPGSQGEDEENDDGKGRDEGEIKPESLAGKEENAGREGQELPQGLSPDQAGKMLDSLPVDSGKRLPMGGDKEAAGLKENPRRNW